MSDEWKTDYDKRQCASMRDALRLYETGTINLDSLITGLHALFNALEMTDDLWRNEFLRGWGTIEDVYASAMYRVEQSRSENLESILKEPDNQARISAAIESLKHLLKL